MKLLQTAIKQIDARHLYKYWRLGSVTKATSPGGLSSSQQQYIDGSSSSQQQYNSIYIDGSWELVTRLGTQVEVQNDFINEEEECALLQELEPGLKKKRYEFDHWDDAICGYRETERTTWGPVCEGVLRRVRAAAFPEGSNLLGPVHVLDLDKDGYIKPHIDSVKFCGSTIAGLNLLSSCVMRLLKADAADERLDLLLRPRSLYILRDKARYDFTHEVLRDEQSLFQGRRVPRQRRLSVICRNLPG